MSRITNSICPPLITFPRLERKRQSASRLKETLLSFRERLLRLRCTMASRGSRRIHMSCARSTWRCVSCCVYWQGMNLTEIAHIQSTKTLQLYKGHTGPVTSIAFCDRKPGSGDRQILISGSWDNVRFSFCSASSFTSLTVHVVHQALGH
jgi:hypothetical protein